MPYVTVCFSTNFRLGHVIHNRNHKCYQLFGFLDLQIFLEYVGKCDHSAVLATRERRLSYSFPARAESFGAKLAENPRF
jgi:hypothetical protein